MATPNGLNPHFYGLTLESITLTPDDAQGAINSIPSTVRAVQLGANVNGVNDFTVLPPLASVPSGHEITIIAGAANSELRTPAGSDEEINSENADGTTEALLAATNIYKCTKISNTIGWMLIGFTAIGAVQAAIVPN